MGGDSDSFFGRMVEGGVTGAGIGAVSGTMSTFWNSAGAQVNRAKLAQQVVPTIAANMGYLAGTGMVFKGGEALMETWTGKEGEAINSAFGGACAGAFIGFRSGSIPMMAATAAGCSLLCVAIHLNGNKLT